MPLHIKCITCGKVLTDKYFWCYTEAAKLQAEDAATEGNLGKPQEIYKIEYFTAGSIKKTPIGRAMDKCRLFDQCCRRHILTDCE